ncbi:MAG: hypothetical protein WA317_12220 [Mycobacterium sp.]|uniref:hypothetical protein n=1 Tax=Mycobacterium sp. TaxID=1785 RepID=UPI003CC6B071
MRNPSTGFRAAYGSSALHLLTMVAGFALLGYLILTAKPSTLWTPEGSWWKSMALWFAAAIIFHDLVLFPGYALADRMLGVRLRRRKQPRVSVRNHLRVPALGSGLMLLVFFPGILRQGATLYGEDTGLTQQPFLGRWLMLTAVLFGGSALSYAIQLTVAQRRNTTTIESRQR